MAQSSQPVSAKVATGKKNELRRIAVERSDDETTTTVSDVLREAIDDFLGKHGKAESDE